MTEAQIERLINKAKTGNKRAFEKLLRQKEDNIAYIALGILKNEHDAEDAVQEAVFAMYRSIQDLHDSKSFNSWMYKTVYRSCLRIQEKRKRGSGVELDDDNGGLLIEERTELIPETNQEFQERRRYFMEKLGLLPENYRSAMYLFYFEDMPYVEIAKVLDCSKKDVSNWLERGKARLRTELEKDGISDKKEIQSMLSVSAISAIFAADIEKSLTADQKMMVEHALEATLGATGVGVISSAVSAITSAMGSLLASKAIYAVLSGLVAISLLSIGALVYLDRDTGQASDDPHQTISLNGDAAVGENNTNNSSSEQNKSDNKEQNFEDNKTPSAVTQEPRVEDSTITEGRDENGAYFIIENEVYFEIMDDYDEDKFNSADDPDMVSNTVTAVVSEGNPWSRLIKTGDVFLCIALACGVLALLGLSAMLIARKRK